MQLKSFFVNINPPARVRRAGQMCVGRGGRRAVAGFERQDRPWTGTGRRVKEWLGASCKAFLLGGGARVLGVGWNKLTIMGERSLSFGSKP